MASESNIGHIINTLIFSHGMIRLKNFNENIKYTIKAIPQEYSEIPMDNGKKIMRKCLGGCEKMFLTTKENRICSECTEMRHMISESYNEIDNDNLSLFICNHAKKCKLEKGRGCLHKREHTNIKNKCDVQDIYCEKGGMTVRCVEI